MLFQRRMILASALAIAAIAVTLGSLRNRSDLAEANHAQLHAQGIGYDAVGPDYGWVNVYRNSTSTSYAAALVAIDNWRAQHAGNVWWLRDTSLASEAQAEVIDRDTATLFGPGHLYACNTDFIPTQQKPDADDFYATTIVSDTAGAGRGLDGSGFWQQGGYPFWHSTVCLNSHQTNNAGTVAHELGHVLGLDHPTAPGAPCPETNARATGLRTVMAYNYIPWQDFYPPLDASGNVGPTYADVWGPWVCNASNAGGLAYIYQLPPYYGLAPLVDSDGDGCPDGREALLTPPTNPNDPWDFYSVPVPALFAAEIPTTVFRDAVVSAPDAQAVFAYFKRGARTGTLEYEQDRNLNGIKDGIEYDRTIAGPGRSGPPDGIIGAGDAQLDFAQARYGYNCS